MKTKVIRGILGIVGAFCLLISGIPVQASENKVEYVETITPRYVNIISTSSTLSIKDGVATCTGKVIVNSSKSCSVTVTLQKKSGSNWVDVKSSWSGSGIEICTVKGTKTVVQGVSYRVKTEFSCGSESGSVFSTVKKA